MIAVYKHFFWNTPNIDGEGEWDELLRGHPSRDKLLRAWRGDDLQALYLAGFKPAAALRDPKAPLRDAYRQLHFDLVALQGEPSTMANVRVRAGIAKELRELYTLLHDTEGASAIEQIKRFAGIVSMKHTPIETTTADQIRSAGGSISGDPD